MTGFFASMTGFARLTIGLEETVVGGSGGGAEVGLTTVVGLLGPTLLSQLFFSSKRVFFKFKLAAALYLVGGSGCW